LARPVEAELVGRCTVSLRFHRLPVGGAFLRYVTVAPLPVRDAHEVEAFSVLTVLRTGTSLSDRLCTAFIVAGHHIQAVAMRLAGCADVVHAIGIQTIPIFWAVLGAEALHALARFLVAHHVLVFAIKIRFAEKLLVALVVGTTDLSIGAVFVAHTDDANSLVLVADQDARAVLGGVARRGDAITFSTTRLQIGLAHTALAVASVGATLPLVALRNTCYLYWNRPIENRRHVICRNDWPSRLRATLPQKHPTKEHDQWTA